MSSEYAKAEPAREDIEALAGPAVLEFGTSWCGHCRAAQSAITAALREHPAVKHVKVEDGSGRPLGRSFRVKLWPTLIFLADGREVGRLVRPREVETIRDALAHIDPR